MMFKRFSKSLEPRDVVGLYMFIQAFALSSFILIFLLLVIGHSYYSISKQVLLIGGALLTLTAAIFVIAFIASAQAAAIHRSAITATKARLHQLEKEQQHWLFLNHELRSMVAGQLMTARGLYSFFSKHPEYGENEKTAHALVYSLSQSERLYNNVIDMERLSSGIFDTVQETPIQIRQWLRMHTHPSQEVAKGRSVRFSLRLSSTLPLSFSCDQDKLLIIINNLLSNALAHTPEGGVIVVEAAVVANAWCLTVSNTGPCIPPALLPVLFDKFSAARKGKAGSSGIGLFVTRQLVCLLNGTITVKSENFHTDFTVTLPLKEENCNPPLSIPSISEQHDLYNDYLRDKTALVMEDNELFQLVLRRSLTSFGIGKVLVASNGEDGTRMAEKFNPNFILLDMQMPGKHGDELLTELRASLKTKHTPIIAVTATGLDKMAPLQKKHNLCAVLPKPIPELELFNTLTAC